MNNIFTKDASNRQRQIELDIAKGLAIIFMVWVHVNEYFQADLYHGGTYNRVVEFLLFMACKSNRFAKLFEKFSSSKSLLRG